jgi:thiosulfate dehydrogenase [quinone] large subunit
MMRLVRDRRLAFVWLAVRLWLGWQFINAGWEKLTGSGWVGSGAPAGIHGFLAHAGSSAMTSGAHAPVATWYAALIHHIFLPTAIGWSYLIAIGEFAVGIGLVLGAFTLAAAFFGAFMNFNYLLAGSTSAAINPIMLVLGLLLLVAGSAAYAYGLDRVLMPRVHALLGRIRLPSLHQPRPLAHEGR